MSVADYFVYFLVGVAVVVFALNVMRVPLARARDAIVSGFQRVRISQVALGVVLVSLALIFFDYHAWQSGVPQFFLAASVVVLLVSAWVREFQFLMALTDDDFPGRFDKPIWAAVLVFAAPVGLFLFRAHRLAQWPEPKPKPRVAPEVAGDLI